MVPADQRLEARDLAAFDLDQRLVMQLELFGEQRLAQIEFELAPLLHLRVHFRLEEMEGAAAVGLGAIERHVGIAQQLIGLVAVGRRHGDADRGADDDLMAVHVERLEQRVDDARGELAGIGRIGLAVHDGELVAAEPRHGLGAGHHALQPLAYRAQQRIADRMTERIVDALEAVEVEEHHRQFVAAAQRLHHLVLEHHPVRQVGQRVVPRHVNDLGLGAPALGDVFIGRDPAAVGGRAVQAGNHPAVVEFIKMRRLVAVADQPDALRPQLIGGFVGMIPHRDADLDHFLVGHARPDPIGRQAQDFEIAPVVDLEPVLGIVEAQPLRHVFQRGVEQQIGFAQRPFLLLQPADVAAQHDEAFVARRAAADAQPAAVGHQGFAGRLQVLVAPDQQMRGIGGALHRGLRVP